MTGGLPVARQATALGVRSRGGSKLAAVRAWAGRLALAEGWQSRPPTSAVANHRRYGGSYYYYHFLILGEWAPLPHDIHNGLTSESIGWHRQVGGQPVTTKAGMANQRGFLTHILLTPHGCGLLQASAMHRLLTRYLCVALLCAIY